MKYDYRWAGSLAMTKFNQDWQQTEAGTYGQSIDEYKTTSLRLQQLVGERGEFTLAKTRITDDSTANGGAGSGGANNVICDDTGTLTAAQGIGKTVKCRAVNNNSATKHPRLAAQAPRVMRRRRSKQLLRLRWPSTTHPQPLCLHTTHTCSHPPPYARCTGLPRAAIRSYPVGHLLH